MQSLYLLYPTAVFIIVVSLYWNIRQTCDETRVHLRISIWVIQSLQVQTIQGLNGKNQVTVCVIKRLLHQLFFHPCLKLSANFTEKLLQHLHTYLQWSSFEQLFILCNLNREMSVSAIFGPVTLFGILVSCTCVSKIYLLFPW